MHFTVTGSGETTSLWTALIMYTKFQLYLHIHNITQHVHCNVLYVCSIVVRLITATYCVLLYITWWTSAPVWWYLVLCVGSCMFVLFIYSAVQCSAVRSVILTRCCNQQSVIDYYYKLKRHLGRHTLWKMAISSVIAELLLWTMKKGSEMSSAPVSCSLSVQRDQLP